MKNVFPRDGFVNWVYEGGLVTYPDREELFTGATIVYVDGTRYVAATYTGDELITPSVSYDDFFDSQYRDELVAIRKAEIKAKQTELLDALEGTPSNPGMWQRKFIEEITIKDSFERYDELMRRKAYVINKGNEEELQFSSMTPDELMTYKFEVDYADAPLIKIRRITVGAFFLRFTPEESAKFNQAVEADYNMKAALDSLNVRTHVHLDNPTIQQTIGFMAQAKLLVDQPLSEEFETRVEELLRDGNADEQYRVLSYI